MAGWNTLAAPPKRYSCPIFTVSKPRSILRLGIFCGILVGFLLGLYRRLLGKDEINQIYLFWLLLLLHLLSQKEFQDPLLPNLSDSSNIAYPLEDFGPRPQIESRPFKLILKEPEKIPQIPFPILDDLSVNVEIEVHFIWNETINYSLPYKFELFQFYQTLSEKVKH